MLYWLTAAKGQNFSQRCNNTHTGCEIYSFQESQSLKVSKKSGKYVKKGDTRKMENEKARQNEKSLQHRKKIRYCTYGLNLPEWMQKQIETWQLYYWCCCVYYKCRHSRESPSVRLSVGPCVQTRVLHWYKVNRDLKAGARIYIYSKTISKKVEKGKEEERSWRKRNERDKKSRVFVPSLSCLSFSSSSSYPCLS